MDEKLLKDILSDADFATSLMEMETPEDVQKALSEKGADISIGDINAIRKALENGGEGELSEDDLADVAGGSLTILAAAGIAGIISASVYGGVRVGDGIHKWTRGRW